MADYSPLKGSLLYGKIVVIRRSGEDGSIFPLTTSSCLIGRSDGCSIRVVLPAVSEHQCQVEVLDDDTVKLTNLSQTNPTKLNGEDVTDSVILGHKDVIGIVDRYFRFEYPDGHPSVDNADSAQETMGARKSKSPRKSGTGDMSDTKVLTPSRKPPLPLHHDDSENLAPDELPAKTPLRLSRRRSSSHAADFDPCVTKILTPKIKPPVSTSVTRVQRAEALSGSPVIPTRKSADLRKSLAEIKQRSADSIIESADEAAAASEASPVLPATSGGKRKFGPPAESIASKRKRVSFGAALSPELYDKTLPTGTPIKKGRKPRLSVDSSLDVSSPAKGLLKRRSVAAIPSTTTIHEESTTITSVVRRSPRTPPSAAAPSNPAVSQQLSVDLPLVEEVVSVEVAETSQVAERSSRRSKHVVVKSPHVPHHEMSEEEKHIDETQRRQEGAAFKRLSHSPDGSLSPPTTPASQKLISVSASPVLSAQKSKRPAPSKESLASSSSLSASASKVRLQTTSLMLGTPITSSSPARTPGKVTPVSATKSKTPTKKAVASPRLARSIMTPGRSHVIHTDTPRPKTPASHSKGSRNNSVNPEADKIITPAIDMNKIVALRAIHGKSATPKLTTRKIATPLKTKAEAGTSKPSSARRSGGMRKFKTTWADIVKAKTTTGRPSKKQHNIKAATSSKRTVVRAKKLEVKTPSKRVINIKGFAQSTGHVDSPETIIIQKSKVKSKTPAKQMTSLSEYDNLPPTPAPPTMMFVSPLSTEKKRQRKSALSMLDTSPELKGVKEMLKTPKQKSSPKLTGLSRMMKTPKQVASPKLTGLREMIKTPKADASPKMSGLKEMMKSPREQMSPKLAGLKEMMQIPKHETSPRLTGVKEMMKTPKPRRSVNVTGLGDLFVEVIASPTEMTPPPVKSRGRAKRHANEAGLEKDETTTVAKRSRRQQNESQPETPAKPTTRGRRAKPVGSSETKKPTSGRRAKIEDAEVEEPVAVTNKVTRGRKVKAGNTEPTVTEVKKGTRGRKPAVAIDPVNADVASQDAKAITVKRRGKRVVATVTEESEPTKELPVSPIKKATRGRKVTAAVAKTKQTPVKVSRSGAKKQEITYEANEKQSLPKRRGRKAAVETEVVEKISAEEKPPGKRGRGKQEKATPKEGSDKKATSSSRTERVDKAAPKRGRSKAVADDPKLASQKKTRGRPKATTAGTTRASSEVTKSAAQLKKTEEKVTPVARRTRASRK